MAELKYKSLYEDQEFDIYLIKFVQCMYNLPNKDSWTLDGGICHRSGDNWPCSQSRPSGGDSKLGNFAASRIQIHYFGRQISTFFQTNTLKTECVVHWIAERETTGPTLWFQRKISWVNALFVCNLTRFRRVFVVTRQTGWSFPPCLYLLHSSALNFQIRSNDLKSR